MDSDSGKELGSEVAIEKLARSKFHFWKEDTNLIVTYREAEFVFFEKKSFGSGSS